MSIPRNQGIEQNPKIHPVFMIISVLQCFKVFQWCIGGFNVFVFLQNFYFLVGKHT